MYQYPDYLMHYGVKGMRWGVRRAKKKAERLDRKDERYVKKHVSGFDLSSKESRKKAGKEIDASNKAWHDYMNSMNTNGRTHSKSIKAYKKWQKAHADMMTKLVSDVKLPSGRKMKYLADAMGTYGNMKYYEFV